MSEERGDLPGWYNLELEDVIDLVKQAFPDLSCLRCGHEDFFVAHRNDSLGLMKYDDENKWRGSGPNPIGLLICQRCGHIEYHLLEQLWKADKPIPQGVNNG
jgi:ribosomal protein L37E